MMYFKTVMQSFIISIIFIRALAPEKKNLKFLDYLQKIKWNNFLTFAGDDRRGGAILAAVAVV
jgi:hypothetical protein